MTFELMNSCGKGLSTLELLKNYLMHWTYRNIPDKNEKTIFTEHINTVWKNVYTNIADCNGNEDQCLRIAWILCQSHIPKHWKGYNGFKEQDVIPLRDFATKTHEDTKQYIQGFTDNLAIISRHYSEIIKPTDISSQEYDWLTKIRNAGNTANFLPLMVAARIKQENNTLQDYEYIELLKSLEKFTYRVYLWEGKRNNTGLTMFYKQASEIFNHKPHIQNIINEIYGSINWYSEENTFRDSIKASNNWYAGWARGLKYTLYEYELWLLKEEGTGARPKLDWKDLTDSTIEHILPQNPRENSGWKKKWNDKDIETYVHDISNLVLTNDNSRYSNFDFDRKKGTAGTGHCYSNSDIRQERKIARYDDWTVDSCKKRQQELEQWIIERWGIKEHYESPTDVNDEDDIDE